MHYSGILVRCRPDDLDLCAAQVEACEGVEVHLRHEEAGCLVAVIETESLDAQQDRLRAVQKLPAVATAELVYHRSDDSEEVLP